MHSQLHIVIASLAAFATPQDTIVANPVVVTGLVIDAQARPVADADVRAFDTATGVGRHVRTDETGHYVVRLAHAGDRVDVVVRRIGSLPARVTLARAPDTSATLVADVQLADVPLAAEDRP